MVLEAKKISAIAQEGGSTSVDQEGADLCSRCHYGTQELGVLTKDEDKCCWNCGFAGLHDKCGFCGVEIKNASRVNYCTSCMNNLNGAKRVPTSQAGYDTETVAGLIARLADAEARLEIIRSDLEDVDDET